MRHLNFKPHSGNHKIMHTLLAYWCNRHSITWANDPEEQTPQQTENIRFTHIFYHNKES